MRDTIIIGNRNNAIEAYHALQSEPYLGFQIKGFVGRESVRLPADIDLPIIVNEGELLEQVDKEITQFIVALEQDEFEQRNEWLRYFSKNNCRMVTVVPTIRGLPLYGTDFSFLFSHDVIMLRIHNNLARRSSQLIKRSVDIVGAFFLLFLTSFFWLPLWGLLVLNGGQAIYRHRRIGRDGKEFNCYKFRSMVPDAQAQLEALLATDPAARKEWRKTRKLKNDPRVTGIGRFIRRYSLDELPQLWNVLKGSMSLVGPRPVTAEELAHYEGDVEYYLMTRPGITGIWQISGRSNVDYDTRVYFDSWYVRNWSLWNDIVILCKTVGVVLNRDGAY